MSSAPKGALVATSISQEVQPTIRIHGRRPSTPPAPMGQPVTLSVPFLCLHPGFRPGPPLSAPEASTTDMATGSPSQCTSF
ncbi:hypothetical protein V6N13_137625 [Hibiscus sabdariffa]